MTGTPSQSTGFGPQVHLAAGIVRGAPRDARGVLAFKGIPYAAPPSGDLRWRAPEPPHAWVGVRDATQFVSRCWSAWQSDPTPWPPQSEDCLSINVWTAAQQADERRPAMVWVHGGGFEFGTSADPSTDGALLAQQGVVLVSFNYRVGVPGFLAHPALDQGGRRGIMGCKTSWLRSAGCRPTSRSSAEIPTMSRCSASRRVRTPSAS